MYNHYPEQTKRNVVAAHRAGITFSTLSTTINIPKSTIDTWNKSKRYIDVALADEILLSHLFINQSFNYILLSRLHSSIDVE